MLKISKRLCTVAQYVRDGAVVADIGTDHAYLPIYLMGLNLISKAVAADINKGPLDKAKENIDKYGYADSISTVLSDGLKKVSPDLVDDIAIFGMGGELIVKIIDEAPWLKDTNKRLILQPMTHPEKLREYLFKNGYKIIGESLSLDRGKIYQTICAEFDGKIYTPDLLALYFGEYTLLDKSPLLLELMCNTQKKLERKIIGKIEGGEDVSFEKQLISDIQNYIER